MMSSAPLGTSRSPLTPVLSLREGDLLGDRYRVESLLHARSASVLFAATDLKSGTRVTAHVLLANAPAGDGDAVRAAFLKGARKAKALMSPYTARILDVGATSDGRAWSVREHLGSDTLEAHLRKHGAISTSDAIDVALAVCDSISEAHAHEILHLSLGPRSVHVAWSASGLADVKVTGAGTAVAETTLALGSSGDVESVLRSPEQLRHGTQVDARADVWAIAVLLHTMLAGAPPFSADTPSGASLSVVIDDPPSLAGVPDELADIVERALAKEPSARPNTVLELAELLATFASQPEVARNRISQRRARLELILPTESDPTLIVHESDYAALAKEQPAPGKPAAKPLTKPPVPKSSMAPPPPPPTAKAAPPPPPPTAKMKPAAPPPAPPAAKPAAPPPAPVAKAASAPPPVAAETKRTDSKPPAAGLKTLAFGSVKKIAVSKPPPPPSPKATATAAKPPPAPPSVRAAVSKPPPPPAATATAKATLLMPGGAPPPSTDVVTSAPPMKDAPKAAPAAKLPEVAPKPVDLAPTPKMPAAAEPTPTAPMAKAAEQPEPTVPLDSEDLIVEAAPPSVRSLVPSEPMKPLLPSVVGAADTTAKRAVQKSNFPRRAFQAIGLMTAAACVTLLVLVGTEGAHLSKAPAPTPATAPNEGPASTATAAAAAAPPAAITPNELPSPVMRPGDLPAAPNAAAPHAHHPVAAPPAVAPPPPAAAAPPPVVAVEPPPAPPPAEKPAAAPEKPAAAAPVKKASAPASQPSPSGSSDDLRRFLDDRR
jgi:serine/threonine protein kinase